jgi:hypothetical protein
MSALSVAVEGSEKAFVFFRVATLRRWAERPVFACRTWEVTVHEADTSHSFHCRSGDLAERCERAGLPS